MAAIALSAGIVLPKGIARIRDDEVGVAVHDWSGEIELKERAIITFPVLSDKFLCLDKTIHRRDLS